MSKTKTKSLSAPCHKQKKFYDRNQKKHFNYMTEYTG